MKVAPVKGGVHPTRAALAMPAPQDSSAAVYPPGSPALGDSLAAVYPPSSTLTAAYLWRLAVWRTPKVITAAAYPPSSALITASLWRLSLAAWRMTKSITAVVYPLGSTLTMSATGGAALSNGDRLLHQRYRVFCRPAICTEAYCIPLHAPCHRTSAGLARRNGPWIACAVGSCMRWARDWM